MSLQIKQPPLRIALMAFCLLFGVSASAQEAASEEEAPKPTTTGNAEVSVEELGFRLKPLTQDELTVEADGWIGVLQNKANEISDAQIKALTAEGAAKDQALEAVTELQEQRTAVIDRVNTAIEALRNKGGEVETYEKIRGRCVGHRRQRQRRGRLIDRRYRLVAFA